MYNNNPIRRKAITIKEISGKCIEPIPTGKVFVLSLEMKNSHIPLVKI